MNYRELLEAAKRDPAGADYHTLRRVYARSDEYNPYSADAENVNALRGALQADDLDAALAAIDALLAANYLDIEAHMAADYIHLRRNEADQSAYHRAFAQGLIDAILATGSGRDFATAFIALSVPEEYVALRMLGLAPAGQRLVEHEGHSFDILTARHPESGQTVELYFNIDLPRRWLGDHLGE